METQFGRKPPLLLSQSSIFIIKKTSYNFMLVQTHTSMQAPTCRRLQPSLIYQPFLEGSYNPLFSFTNYHWKGATNLSLKASTLRSTADHVSSTFTQHTLQATRFIHFLQRCILNSAIYYPFHIDILQSEVFIHNPYSCIHSS